MLLCHIYISLSSLYYTLICIFIWIVWEVSWDCWYADTGLCQVWWNFPAVFQIVWWHFTGLKLRVLSTMYFDLSTVNTRARSGAFSMNVKSSRTFISSSSQHIAHDDIIFSPTLGTISVHYVLKYFAIHNVLDDLAATVYKYLRCQPKTGIYHPAVFLWVL